MTMSPATAVLVFSLLALAAVCQKKLVTRSRIGYLKQHAKYQVSDYEDNIFRGWTVEEAKEELMHREPVAKASIPQYAGFRGQLPTDVNWTAKAPQCVNTPQSHGRCSSSWAFAATSMLGERCCIQGHGPVELAVQELVSCDNQNGNRGCSGGWPLWAMEYVMDNHGLVPRTCLDYEAQTTECVRSCADGKDWVASHVCECSKVRQCIGKENMMQCLQSGPITIAYDVCDSYYDYRSGVYECDCVEPLGMLSGDCVGYHNASDEDCYWIVKDSRGTSFGEKGFIRFACNTCKITQGDINANLMCERC